MKRITYLKTLLVGLLVSGATSVWAGETTTAYDFEDGTTNPFIIADANRISASFVNDETLNSKVLKHTCGNMNAIAFAYYDFTELAKNAQIVTVEFDFNIPNVAGHELISLADASFHTLSGGGFTGKSNTGYGSKGAIFNLGCFRGGGNNKFAINSKQNDLEALGVWGHAKIVVDNSEKKVSYIISDKNGTELASASNVGFLNSDAAKCTQIDIYIGTNASGNGVSIDNLSISAYVDETIEQAKYTIRYVDENDNEIKDAATREGAVGGEIALTASDTQSFYANNKKYIYVSDDVEGKTVAEGAVVTVTFREAEVYSWTAKSSVGNYTTSGETFEGDKASVKYPLYQLVEGKLWTKTANDKVFVQNYDVTENNQEFTLEYTETEIDNVVFYAEVEDIEGMSVVNSGNAEARSSQRASGYSASGRTAITSLPLGKYQMYARFYSPTSGGGTYDFFAGNRNIWHATTSNENATDLNQEIVLAKENNEILLGQTGATAAVDFIYIQKLADPTSEELAAAEEADYNADHVKATIGSNGYTTFASSENVSLPSGVTAYTAEVSGNYVNFTKVENGEIPANTGVLLEGTAGEITLDVVATATALGTNDFKVNTSGATFAAAENTTYFAMVKDSDPLKFGTVNPSTVAIPANKAYLAVVGNSEARLTVTFDGETTAIKSIDNAETSNAIYNLNGQRVEKAQKGLYIVNGKKTIVK